MTESRRQFLKASGTVVGTGALAALAGCSGILGGGGGGGGLAGNYTKWLHEPGEFQDDDHYGFSVRAQIEMAEYEDEIDETYYENQEEGFESSFDYLGIDFDEVSGYLNLNNAVVMSGYQVSREDVVDELEDNDYEEDDEYEGYQVFVGSGQNDAVGIDNSNVVVGFDQWSDEVDDPIDVVEHVVDTRNGDEDRYVDESDALGELSSRLSAGTLVNGGTHEESEETSVELGRFEGAVANGTSLTVNGETSDIQIVVSFADTDDIDTDDFEDWADEPATLDDVDDISIGTSGRSVIVTGTVDTDDIEA